MSMQPSRDILLMKSTSSHELLKMEADKYLGCSSHGMKFVAAFHTVYVIVNCRVISDGKIVPLVYNIGRYIGSMVGLLTISYKIGTWERAMTNDWGKGSLRLVYRHHHCKIDISLLNTKNSMAYIGAEGAYLSP